MSVVFSLFFTPVFGALVQMKNWRTLHQEAEARQSFWWSMAGCGILALDPLFSLILTESKVVDCTITLLLLYLGSWIFFSARRQIHYVRRHFPRGYGRKSWLPILPLGLAGYLVYLLVGFGLLWLGHTLR